MTDHTTLATLSLEILYARLATFRAEADNPVKTEQVRANYAALAAEVREEITRREPAIIELDAQMHGHLRPHR